MKTLTNETQTLLVTQQNNEQIDNQEIQAIKMGIEKLLRLKVDRLKLWRDNNKIIKEEKRYRKSLRHFQNKKA